jgi:pimeloyl-ACP methyl ester carboxylesterase
MFIIMPLILNDQRRGSLARPATCKHSQLQIPMITVRVWLVSYSSLVVIFLSSAYCAAHDRELGRAGAQPRIDLRICGFATYDTKVLCGKFDVFEDRAAQTGRKIALRVVVLPALDYNQAPDPVFFLSGGPGQGAAKIASAGEDSLMSLLRRKRDLIFIDQRGTGDSHPLNCNLYSNHVAAQSYFEELFPLDKIRACRTALERGADLKLYNTPIAMADLDEARAALGYEKINLYGISYGTLLALQYLHHYPKRVRALVLAGVATPAAKLPLHFAKGAQAALDRLLQDCAAEKDCRAAFPDLQADFAKVRARFDSGPVTLAIPRSKGRESYNLTLSHGVFAEQLKNMLYNLSSASLVPLLIHRAAQGDWSALGRIVAGTSMNAAHAPALGTYLTVTCSESVPFISEAEIARATEGTFMGDYRIKVHRQACREWPRASIPASYFEPVHSSAPALMLSGELDGATPAQLGADAARSLSNSRQILLRSTAHGYASDCVKGIIAQFIAKGSAQDLDIACADQLLRPPFAKELPTRYAR